MWPSLKNFKLNKKYGLWIPSVCGPTCWTHPAYLPTSFPNDIKLLSKICKLEKILLNAPQEYLLVGGSVLDYPYLKRLCEFLKQKHKKVALFTHLMFERKFLKENINCFDSVKVQLPVADKETFNSIVGIDYYDRYLANLQDLSQECRLEIVMEVKPQTVSFLPEAVDEAFYLGAKLSIFYDQQGFSKDELAHIKHFKQKKYVSINRVDQRFSTSICPCRWGQLLCDHVIL